MSKQNRNSKSLTYITVVKQKDNRKIIQTEKEQKDNPNRFSFLFLSVSVSYSVSVSSYCFCSLSVATENVSFGRNSSVSAEVLFYQFMAAY